MENATGKDQLPQLDKDQYLAKLPDVDRDNLQRIIQIFESATKQTGRTAALVAVGGTLTKPLPRKDIDLLVILDKNDRDPRKDEYPDYHQYSVADFQILSGLISGMIQQDPSFKIKEVLEPAIDEEFQSPGILKHDGSISVKGDAGAELEFIRIADRGTAQDVMQKQLSPHLPPRPYVILT